jgi:hypothetical protein
VVACSYQFQRVKLRFCGSGNQDDDSGATLKRNVGFDVSVALIRDIGSPYDPVNRGLTPGLRT